MPQHATNIFFELQLAKLQWQIATITKNLVTTLQQLALLESVTIRAKSFIFVTITKEYCNNQPLGIPQYPPKPCFCEGQIIELLKAICLYKIIFNVFINSFASLTCIYSGITSLHHISCDLRVPIEAYNSSIRYRPLIILTFLEPTFYIQRCCMPRQFGGKQTNKIKLKEQ